MTLDQSYRVYTDKAKQAVIDRYNALRLERSRKNVDWGELFAELIAAYVKAK